jgi:hypothetical protein
MATKEYIFEGKATWLLSRPNKFGFYTVNFYPDAETRKAVKATGVKNNPKLDENDEVFFIFRSANQYPVLDPAGEPLKVMVGNGSKIKLKLKVETFDSQFGPNARSEIVEIIVTDLIPYEKKDKTEKQEKSASLPTD